MSAQPIIQILSSYSGLFHPVVPFIPAKEKLILLDFTVNNKEITDDILADTVKFIDYVNNKLKTANALYGIGGYAEHRSIYSISKHFDHDLKVSSFGGDIEGAEAEPRRLHLGIDIWGKPHTAVMAPLDGIVHSFAFNDHFGDYGTTIILSHQLDGFTFYTLYGHLSLSSIKNLVGGERIKKGDVFAEFGIPMENGQWPPHLHFQIIIDLEIPITPPAGRAGIGKKGDYPGVCKYSEREKYLTNCPDPDLILQMNKHISF